MSKKKPVAIVAQMNKMKEAIQKNPTPELLAAYEEFFGEKLEVDLSGLDISGKVETTLDVTLPKGGSVTASPKQSALTTNRVRRRPDDNDEDDDDGFEDDSFERELDQRRTGRSRSSRRRAPSRQGAKQKACVSRAFEPPQKINFVDAKGDRDPEVLEADKWDKKHAKCPVTPRNREGFQKEFVFCRKCGDEFEVSPSLIPPSGRFICNSCCATGG